MWLLALQYIRADGGDPWVKVAQRWTGPPLGESTDGLASVADQVKVNGLKAWADNAVG